MGAHPSFASVLLEMSHYGTVDCLILRCRCKDVRCTWLHDLAFYGCALIEIGEKRLAIFFALDVSRIGDGECAGLSPHDTLAPDHTLSPHHATGAIVDLAPND